MSFGVQVELVHATPTAEQLSALRALASAAQSADGAPPFGDQTWVELSSGMDGAVAVAYAWVPEDNDAARLSRAENSARAGSSEAMKEGERTGAAGTSPALGTLVGAGVVVLGDAEESGEAAEPNLLELVVHPDLRERGIGSELAAGLYESLPSPRPAAHRAWAHGGHQGAPRLARKFGWAPVRELWQMRLENHVELAEAELPVGVQLRSFRPGQDEQAWLKVNAAAFADHPEQGRITMEDLQARMAEEWFSAEGFLMAWDSAQTERLLGFHWTKIHTHEDGERLGEVYVVGVAPAAQGQKLGRVLTTAGIDHLRRAGVDAVILYVDAENVAAAELYKKLGFTVAHTDIQYAPSPEPGAEAP